MRKDYGVTISAQDQPSNLAELRDLLLDAKTGNTKDQPESRGRIMGCRQFREDEGVRLTKMPTLIKTLHSL